MSSRLCFTSTLLLRRTQSSCLLGCSMSKTSAKSFLKLQEESAPSLLRAAFSSMSTKSEIGFNSSESDLSKAPSKDLRTNYQKVHKKHANCFRLKLILA